MLNKMFLSIRYNAFFGKVERVAEEVILLLVTTNVSGLV